MRALSARTLGDGDRLVESSDYLISFNNGVLTEAADRGYRFPEEELAQIRQDLTAIANNLGGDLDIADPQRLATVLENVEGLIRYVDEYPQAE